MKAETRLSNFLAVSKLFELQYRQLVETHQVDYHVLNLLLEHFFAYRDFAGLSDSDAAGIHMNFLTEYNRHLNEFSKTGLYPYQQNYLVQKERVAYDIPLLCSSFLSKQRYTIFETLHRHLSTQTGKSILIAGVGPGIELALLNHSANRVMAFDLEVSSFVSNRFPLAIFYQGLFEYVPHRFYDIILLIEILEHLENPFALLSDAIRSLAPGGLVHFTTAVNLPQFDHLYNFRLNDEKLESLVEAHQCSIIYRAEIPHHYKVKVDGCNEYYIVQKPG